MLSDKILADLMDIKQAPSNLSQDAIRVLYNENFRKIRVLLQTLYSDSLNNTNIIQNLNISFPQTPDPRLQYVMIYNPSIQKWVVSEYLGTQNLLEDGEAVKIGSKHQHVVNESMTIDNGAEVILEAGGELVVLDSSNTLVVPYEIKDPLEELSLQHDYMYNSINIGETVGNIEVLKNVGGDPVNNGDVIYSTDYLRISSDNPTDLNKKVYLSITKV
jgi:hypothetical protein